jgi:guanylate kinase
MTFGITMEFISSCFVFSAPSGAGKTTIVRGLAKKYPQLSISISATTRKRRDGETNGRDYIFLSREQFKSAIKRGEFLEYEEVHGEFYGTLKKSVDDLIRAGKIVLFDIDVNGAISIKKHYTKSVLFFIKPPNRAELVNRLKKRRSETDESIQKRLNRLNFEYEQAEKFDHTIINDNLNEAVKKIESIILK